MALNPIDYYMRDFGFIIASYPAIIGSYIGGTIIAAGSSTSFKPGTRVATFAQTFFAQGAPDYGAFQAKALIPATNVAPSPDSVLVWGGASSIGSAAIQTAKMVGMTVYTTAIPKHHEYLKSLGAKETFDYHNDAAVEQMVKAAKGDDIASEFAFDAAGQVRACLVVLKELKTGGTPKLATAVPMSDQTSTEDGVEVKFVAAPKEEKPKMELFEFVMNKWLKENLESGEHKPSPAIKAVDGDFESLNKGLGELKGGMSGTKLVVEI
ncbi:MAG: hypothetical protein Q9192_004414 [Flavoplaca navasiana]